MKERIWFAEYDEEGNPIRLRMDQHALDKMARSLRGDSQVGDDLLSVELFWLTLRPRAVSFTGRNDYLTGYEENPPPLTTEKENAVLCLLAELERECRIPYTPDYENWRNGTTMEQFNRGSKYIHIAAASALRHLMRDGQWDYVTQTLEEVRRVLYLLGLGPAGSIAVEDLGAHLRVAETVEDMVSLWGIRSLIHAVLSDVRRTDGEYEEAFMLAADAVLLSDAVSEAVDLDEEFLKGIVGEDSLKIDGRIRSEVRRCTPIFDMNPQNVVDSFLGVWRQGKSNNWRGISHLCRMLAITEDEKLILADITNENGWNDYWPAFWYRMEGWATAQLSPNELREFMRDQEREASERRLRSYFFADYWGNLPAKSQESLVNVDILWFSTARGTNVGSVLNDLQVAAETICYQYIWEPLREATGGQSLLEFFNRDNELKIDEKSPTLADYDWACRMQFFREFVKGAELSEEDQRFLLQRLRRALNDLYRARNRSQHDPNVRLTRQEVEPFVRRFLGIGQEGVLRRLAQIGPKLTRR